jgi:hypothetical protein
MIKEARAAPTQKPRHEIFESPMPAQLSPSVSRQPPHSPRAAHGAYARCTRRIRALHTANTHARSGSATVRQDADKRASKRRENDEQRVCRTTCGPSPPGTTSVQPFLSSLPHYRPSRLLNRLRRRLAVASSSSAADISARTHSLLSHARGYNSRDTVAYALTHTRTHAYAYAYTCSRCTHDRARTPVLCTDTVLTARTSVRSTPSHASATRGTLSDTHAPSTRQARAEYAPSTRRAHAPSTRHAPRTRHARAIRTSSSAPFERHRSRFDHGQRRSLRKEQWCLMIDSGRDDVALRLRRS